MIDELIAFFEIPVALALRFRRTTAVLALITAFSMGVCGVNSAGVGPARSYSAALTPATWADALLQQLGVPDSTENVRAIMGWERAEGGHWENSAAYNPLNTTQAEPGSRSINSAGVQAYSSWAQGLTATVATLQNGRYGGILAALRIGNCAPCVAAAVSASPWGTRTFAV